MRIRVSVLILLAITMIVSVPETEAADEGTVIYRGSSRAVRFDTSPPLRSITAVAVREPGKLTVDPEQPGPTELGPQSTDPVVQTWSGSRAVPNPSVSFDGMNNIFGGSPPDPVGDVGPNHYVAMSNVYFAVYDKTTGAAVFGPAANNTLWSGFGGACETENAGDPIVLYDQDADRWLLTQFTASGPTYYNCVALSKTSDPTGEYYRWAFTTGSNFPDYPKYGVWPDAYYISTREFAGSSFAGVGAYAIDRSEMIAGNATPQIISFVATPGSTSYNVGSGLLPADMDGFNPPPAGSPHYFLGTMDDGGTLGAPQDALTLWKFVVDFVTPASSSFALTHTIPTEGFDSMFPCSPGSRDCIPQPDTTNKIDVLSYRQRPMHRLAYRNFDTHESLVTNQSVEAGTGMAGMRWYELRDPNGTPTIYQQGTFAPGVTDGIHRWMGSVAMDSAGNMALGYSASDGTSTYPSVWYTGRLAADTLGTMTQGEGSIIDGTGSQTGSQRWGDYSSMNIDPLDDCTFWYVNQYVPTTSSAGWRLRIGAFKFDECGTPDFYLGATPSTQLICAGSDASYDINVGSISSFANPVTLAASDLPAGATASFTTNPVTPAGTSSMTISDTGAVPAGSYVVSIDGTATDSLGHSKAVGLEVFDAAPGTPTLVAPADGAIDQTLAPSFEWSGAVQSPSFTIEIATDAAFSSIVESATVETTTYSVTSALYSNTEYFWRVRANNPCASGSNSTTFSFMTVMMPGDCETGSRPSRYYDFGFESGAGGWTSSGTGDTWAQSSTRAHSGSYSWLATDPATVSDQQLVSPAVELPTGETPLVLRFWNHQTLEDNGATSCYDGGILEISTDDGATWSQLTGAALETDPYDGPVSAGFSNPIGGLDAWCGDPQDWMESVVDLDAFAGDTVRFRFRLGSDTVSGREGWYIDDVVVQSCTNELIFMDGFETGDTIMWYAP